MAAGSGSAALEVPLGEVPPSRLRGPSLVAAWGVVALLPLVGLAALLLHSRLDPNWTDHRVHFVLFVILAAVNGALSFATAEAARKRGDARVLLVSLAFLTTAGFFGLHGLATPMILFDQDTAGFKVAIPVGLFLAALLAVASAFVDLRPQLAQTLVQRERLLRRVVVGILLAWAAYSFAKLPPLSRPASEGASGSALAILAGITAVLYAVAAVRYHRVSRDQRGLLAWSIIACLVLLSESTVGVATTGERAWHASWWLWHFLILVAFAAVAFAARREWRDERFRALYLPTTRERTQEISVLFGDLAGFTPFAERSSPSDVAAMLRAYFELAAPVLSGHGGEVEKFMGDGIMATFNTRGDRPDHALRAARAALALQAEMHRLGEAHPGWPQLRVGVNTGPVVVRELGGRGHVAYVAVGDTVNLGSRLEGLAPPGGVLIGPATRAQLPDGCESEPMPGLRVKGRETPVDAFVLRSLGDPAADGSGEPRAARRRRLRRV